MDRRVTLPKRVTSPSWGVPPPCKQALNNVSTGIVNRGYYYLLKTESLDNAILAY